MKPYKPTIYESAVFSALERLKTEIGLTAEDLPLVYANQDLAELDPPYGLLTTNPGRKQGQDTLRDILDDGRAVYVGDRMGTCEILIIGDRSGEYAIDLQNALQRESASQIFYDTGIVLYSADIIQDGSIRVDTQIQRATLLEFQYRTRIVHNEAINLIEMLLTHYTIQGSVEQKGIMIAAVPSTLPPNTGTVNDLQIKPLPFVLRAGPVAYPVPDVTASNTYNIKSVIFDSSDERILEIITTRKSQFIRCHAPGRAQITATVLDFNGGKHRVSTELQINA